MISKNHQRGPAALRGLIILSLLLHGIFLAALIWFEERPENVSSLWRGGGKSGQIFISLAPANTGVIDAVHDANSSVLPTKPTAKNSPQTVLKAQPSSQEKPTSKPVNQAHAPAKKLSGENGNGQGRGAGDGHDEGAGFDAIGNQKATTLAQIRQKIFARKDYPLVARENGDTGSVRLEFTINNDGTLKDVHLIKSSGVPLLDKAALASVKRATPLPYFPDPIALTLEYTLEQ
jgi:TonB family protein